MPISLDVQAYRGVAPAAPLGHRFDRAGGVLGRGTGSDLVLSDPTKYISRAHARVEFRDGGWFLFDLGGNPSFVNGQLLGDAGPARLQGGERIDIGDYTLVATLEPDNEPAPAPMPVPVPPPMAVAPAVPLYEEAPDALARAAIVDVSGPFDAGFDPALDPLGLNLAPAGVPVPGPAYRGAESDHAPPEQAVLMMPPPVAVVVPAPLIPDDYDPLADALPSRAAVPVAPAMATPAPPEPQPMASAPAKDAKAAPAADDGRVLQALLRGLGVPDLHSRHEPEALAELIGAMLREATAGTIGVLMARSLTKRGSRVEMTMIAPEANNPLKFFPDATTALTHMLQGPLPGYLPPERAFAGAFVDLRAHELAVMAGTRAALAGVLRRFDPAAIEERLHEPGLLAKVFAGGHKTRLWDRMVQVYDQLALEADEDFQRLFGAAFAQAYEEQVRRLRDAGC
ncbi:type VI secretion system-associated FHA domain protein TagH [Massilia sp. YMA4]|uniref:type VI secretion system-associated FHA domain protein TagH n=1 Tax=Massilia sp. YMA4 TaxID=1593482 RepID=UPI000DD183CE|nr:type VI secretion system-associated FHA domain protein TagH [Massilia sp. YMA4]AXA90529.1 type VI secretion system-associated FHA domain protein TagH [Massilia sp. YMA4]